MDICNGDLHSTKFQSISFNEGVFAKKLEGIPNMFLVSNEKTDSFFNPLRDFAVNIGEKSWRCSWSKLPLCRNVSDRKIFIFVMLLRVNVSNLSKYFIALIFARFGQVTIFNCFMFESLIRGRIFLALL